MSFVEKVLHGRFRSSLAKAFWQLAMAPYRSSSCNQVELEGKLWELIVHNPARETLVVGPESVVAESGTGDWDSSDGSWDMGDEEDS